MKLGMRVGLNSGHIVFDGDPAPLPHRAQTANFQLISLVTKWLDGSRCHLVKEVGLSSDVVFDADPPPVPTKGGRAPNFRPMSIVAKRLNGSRCHLVWR